MLSYSRVAPRDDRGPIAPSGPDQVVGPRSGPDCAVGPRSGRDCAVTRSFALQGGILSNTGGKDGPGAFREDSGSPTAEGFHQGSTRVPPGFHQGSTKVPPGFHQGSTRVPHAVGDIT